MRTLLIIAQAGFQDVELKGVRDALLQRKADIVLASAEAGPCTGKYGSTEQAALALADVDVNAYDRIGFIGGPGAEALFDDADAHRIAQETVAAGKVLGAICIAPVILAKAGVLDGKKATVWDKDGEQARMLTAQGAAYTGEKVTIDGLIVTGNGPEASQEFGRVFATI